LETCCLPTEIKKEVRQSCPLSPVLYNIYMDKVIKDWLKAIKQNILMKELILNTIFFVDDLVIVASTEDKMQRAVIGINQYSYKI
jgi:hypothetical protein